MAPELLFRARRAVVGGAESAASVRVRDGVITAVEGLDADAAGADVVELAEDEVLLPGLVDTHVHVNEPGRTDWEGFASATRAAAAGGVTTIVDMPLNSIPPTTTLAGLEAKRAAAGSQAYVDVGFWGGAVPGNTGDLEPLHAAGVFGFKCFLLPSGVEEFPELDARGLAAALEETARLDALLIAHAEDAGLVTEASGRDYRGFVESRPPGAETTAIERLVAAAALTGGRAHVVHLSAADALPVIRTARDSGVRLTVETCPHYLTLTADDVAEGHTEFKCCPPIRDADNRDRLWAALADGTIDAVVSDHSPCVPELKLFDTGDFGEAWGGIASLQLGLPAVWTEARRRGHGLADVVRWMAEGPAGLVGLEGRGRIETGADAHLVAFAPDDTFEVDPARLWHKNPVSAYAGRTLSGTVRRTWLRGTPVDPSGPPAGRLLRRGER